MTDPLIPEILRDRETGTEDAWWRDRMLEFTLPGDMGEHDEQDGADCDRILRLPKVERALLRLAAAARACVHTSPPHEAHAKLATALDEIGAPPHG